MFGVRKVNPIIAVLVIAGFFFLALWIARGMIRILTLLAPVMIIAAAIINYRVILGYGKWLFNTLKENPIFGILAIIFSIVGFPLVSAYLLFKAISTKKEKSEVKRLKAKGEYINYEELDEDFLDLSDVKRQKKDIEDKYDDIL